MQVKVGRGVGGVVDGGRGADTSGGRGQEEKVGLSFKGGGGDRGGIHDIEVGCFDEGSYEMRLGPDVRGDEGERVADHGYVSGRSLEARIWVSDRESVAEVAIGGGLYGGGFKGDDAKRCETRSHW